MTPDQLKLILAVVGTMVAVGGAVSGIVAACANWYLLGYRVTELEREVPEVKADIKEQWREIEHVRLVCASNHCGERGERGPAGPMGLRGPQGENA